MSFWVLVQIFVNIVFLAGMGFLWMRFMKAPQDDPRLSRGLQLLQSKISVLEDLGDRTEKQVHQLTTLLEQKCRELQKLVQESEKQMHKIEGSMAKSLDVAKIFQDKIPHEEIIERQKTVKYVKAARMAHQGASVEEICQQVDLSRGEIEFIAKVNRDQLQFSEEDLPEWTREAELKDQDNNADEISLRNPIPRNNQKTLSDLGSQFRQALQEQTIIESKPESFVETPAPVKVSSPAPKGLVRKVVFPKIEAHHNLG